MHPGVKPIETKQIEPEFEKPPEVKKFPIRLLKGYFPADPSHPRHPDGSGTSIKVAAGDTIHLPIEEAQYVLDNGIGERADRLVLDRL